jgi:hypothetical protein
MSQYIPANPLDIPQKIAMDLSLKICMLVVLLLVTSGNITYRMKLS